MLISVTRYERCAARSCSMVACRDQAPLSKPWRMSRRRNASIFMWAVA